MAVGTLAGMHCSAGTTYVDITFTRPSNCTKIIFIMTATDGVSAAIQKSYTIPLPYAVGATITYRFTGLSSTKKYYLTGRPYNGSTAGTLKTYSNSTSTPINCIVMPSAKTTATSGTTTTTTKSPTTASAGSGPVTTSSSTGTTINGGTVSTSSAAGSNTPTPGATDATIPSDLNSPSRLSLKIPNLEPNQTYSIKVRAFTTDVNGETVYSQYSEPIYITTPGFSASGTNHLTTNVNGDILLSGGSIFAGDFGTDAGLLDVVNGTTDGTGVILNQTGLAGFNAGTREFYIDASTGNAYFAGTIGATVIQSTNYSASIATSEPKYTVAGMQIDLNNGSISSKTFRITEAGNAYFAGTIGQEALIGSTLASTVVSNAAQGLLKIKTFQQDEPPTATQVGDLWYDTNDGYKMYRWNGSSWISVQDGAIVTAANAAAAAQSSANGKNRIIYGAAGTTTDEGQAPNLQYYTVNATTDTFSATYSNSTGNIEGDTWFVRNSVGSIIAQYTIVSGTWTRTTVASQVIGNLDAGKISAGTISVALGITNPSGNFTVDAATGKLTAVNADIRGGLTVASGTNYWTSTGLYANTTSNGTIELYASNGIENGSTDGLTTSYSTKISKIKMTASGGTQIFGIPVQKGVTSIGNYVTDAYTGNSAWGLGSAGRTRVLIEDIYDGQVRLGLGIYYGQRTSPPGASTGYVGDLWVSW